MYWAGNGVVGVPVRDTWTSSPWPSMQNTSVSWRWQAVTAVVCGSEVVVAATDAGVEEVEIRVARVVIADSSPSGPKQYDTEPCIWHPV